MSYLIFLKIAKTIFSSAIYYLINCMYFHVCLEVMLLLPICIPVYLVPSVSYKHLTGLELDFIFHLLRVSQ